MGELFTTTFLNVINNQDAMDKSNVIENMDADEMLFYHSLRTDMDQLQLKPNLQTIHNILNYSKHLR
ncbi:hypothetical protein [Mucilaginibacter polytrichastri]|uniref:Uncharacterized protein n=1 Tax=Mucilaginibacter polytrichastri TaxID=1302689 RepID=A0A1Q6A220_9SPHI|nr:hypothetical protein [Mucilaginibacter polytrichastri]OKS88031.1 hypothetical protein RG47T_3495 [Mucilaginibacter polytrichastri]SFT10377.1 hypothetical protein SAMN04487890_110210 [Mucilaginibacter polytrichastri]